MKKCKYCGVEKAFSEFFLTTRPSGNAHYSPRCKNCTGLAERVCAVCASSFVGKTGNKFCSDDCRIRARPATFKKCLHCATEFGPVDRLSRKFCSLICKVEHQKGVPNASRGKPRPSTVRARVGVCASCSGEFRATKDYKGRPPQKFCSEACRAKKNPEVQTNCLQCGGVFLARPGYKIYCTRACRDAHYRVRLTGENSHFWAGGKTKKSQLLRGSAAYSEWRSAVFERDGYRCVECGVKPGPGLRVLLEADHIKALSEFPEFALDVGNGRTLCRPCHLDTDNHGWKQSKRMRDIRAANDNQKAKRSAS